MLNKIVLFFTLYPCFLFCQNKKEYTVFVSKELEINNSKVFFYDTLTIIKGIYKDSNQTKRLYMEELLVSYLSASNQSWLNSLESSGKAKDVSEESFEKKLKNKDSIRYELLFKITFSQGSNTFSFVKFNFLNKGKKVGGCLVGEKRGNKWYFTSGPYLFKFTSVIMFYSKQGLKEIFSYKKSSNKVLNAIIKDCYQGDNLDFEKFLALTQPFLEGKDNSLDSSKDPYNALY